MPSKRKSRVEQQEHKPEGGGAVEALIETIDDINFALSKEELERMQMHDFVEAVLIGLWERGYKVVQLKPEEKFNVH